MQLEGVKIYLRAVGEGAELMKTRRPHDGANVDVALEMNQLLPKREKGVGVVCHGEEKKLGGILRHPKRG
jgi:hypothetical protein